MGCLFRKRSSDRKCGIGCFGCCKLPSCFGCCKLPSCFSCFKISSCSGCCKFPSCSGCCKLPSCSGGCKTPDCFGCCKSKDETHKSSRRRKKKEWRCWNPLSCLACPDKSIMGCSFCCCCGGNKSSDANKPSMKMKEEIKKGNRGAMAAKPLDDKKFNVLDEKKSKGLEEMKSRGLDEKKHRGLEEKKYKRPEEKKSREGEDKKSKKAANKASRLSCLVCCKGGWERCCCGKSKEDSDDLPKTGKTKEEKAANKASRLSCLVCCKGGSERCCCGKSKEDSDDLPKTGKTKEEKAAKKRRRFACLACCGSGGEKGCFCAKSSEDKNNLMKTDKTKEEKASKKRRRLSCLVCCGGGQEKGCLCAKSPEDNNNKKRKKTDDKKEGKRRKRSKCCLCKGKGLRGCGLCCFKSSVDKKKSLRKKKESRKGSQLAFLVHSISFKSDEGKHRNAAEEILRIGNGNIAARVFQFRELTIATRNFRADCLLGEGGFGRVYKGKLEDTNQIVAVKKLDRNGFQGNREFLVEVLMLSLLHHPNLVNLLGYCADGDQRILVYEYMALGSLEDLLLAPSAHKKPLDWNSRMKIALGSAKGLEYLHDIANPPVIYRDFKASNILLDEEFNPKLSDFGLAKLGPVGDKSHVSTRVMGTYGYCAPEYALTGQLTKMSDVYSFGVVFLEMITGRRAIDISKPTHEQQLVQWAEPLFKDKIKFVEMADPLLKGKYPLKGLYQAIAIASMCLQEDANIRPRISDVVTALEYLATPTKESTEGPRISNVGELPSPIIELDENQ